MTAGCVRVLVALLAGVHGYMFCTLTSSHLPQKDGRLRRTEFDRLMLEADPNQPAMELNRLWNEGVRNSMQRRTTDATGRFTVTLPGLFAVADATNALRYAYRRTYVPPPTDELSPRATVGAALMET